MSDTFDLIPVLDLMHAQVVRGVRGERSRYAAIRSTLARGSDPATLLDALLSLHAFQRVYVADLDAILGGTTNAALIGRLAARHPAIEFWIDGGWSDEAALARYRRDFRAARGPFDAVDSVAPSFIPVLGTESIGATANPDAPIAAGHDAVLSLDSLHGRAIGDPRWQHEVSRWPSRVIAMTLERVGSASGPDLEALVSLHERARDLAPERSIAVYAAGGVRGIDDLRALKDAGIAGVLLASALHDGVLTRSALQAMAP